MTMMKWGVLKTKHLPNDVVTSYSYNNIGRIAKITHHDQKKIIDSYDYTYDNAGNKITVDQKAEWNRNTECKAIPMVMMQ
mgnify:CR=1 FL=1